MPKRKPPESDEDFKEIQRLFFEEILEELSSESDRGCVLVAAALLDENLEMLLRHRFSHKPNRQKSSVDPLFQTMGPLNSFWAKICLAHSLELIEDWQSDDLHIIRELRNKFAHHYRKVDFESSDIIKCTEKLVGADHAIRAIKQGYGRQKYTEEIPQEKINHKPERSMKKERVRFCLTVSYISGGIISSIEHKDKIEDLRKRVQILKELTKELGFHK